jgi:Na+-driven multidrug efflux pump
MYELVLIVHSWLRWFAIIAGVVATVSALSGRSFGDARDHRADKWGLMLMIALDLQLLLGLLLYLAISPTTRAIFNDFGAAMRDPVARFWAVEHVSTMILAVAIAHVGRVLARRAKTARAQRMRSAICFGLATILMIAGTPWPGMRAGRPLFRV